MNSALSLFVVALVGAGPAPNPSVSPIQYRVKVLEMEGVKWRESLYTRLQPVARQGSSVVWTAGQDLVKPLLEQASQVVLSPQLVAGPGAVASYNHRTNRKVASRLNRHADGPVDQAVSVAYTPDFEDLGEGCQFTMLGRKLDQGVLLRLVVDDQRVTAVHHIKLTEYVPSPNGQQGRVAINPQLDVPEVVKATLEGEWLIPNNGMLVASLGAHTTDDGHGKAVVRERLMVVEATSMDGPAALDPAQGRSRSITFTMPAQSPSPIPMPMSPRVPSMPSRTLPLARNAEGVPVPLPPLPEAQVPPTSIPGTSEPCATPQTVPHPKESGKSGSSSDDAPSAEPESKPSSIDTESVKASFESEEKPTGTVPPPVPASRPATKPYLLRVPLGAGLEIEISAKVSPATKP